MTGMNRKPTPRNSSVSDGDRRLFLDAVGPVKRMPSVQPKPRRPPPGPRARMLERDEARVRDELLAGFDPSIMETGAELAWLRDGYSPSLLKRLKRGRYSIGDELDLHHMTAAAARATILDFIDESIAGGMGCVRIIHGKGRRSGPGGPVLKGLTDHVLRRCRQVVAFSSAPPAEGGTGAVLVLLKPR